MTVSPRNRNVEPSRAINLKRKEKRMHNNHKYSVGDKVRVITPFSKLYLYSGEIHAIVPFTFKTPAYDVKIGEEIIPFSERSIEKIEDEVQNDR